MLKIINNSIFVSFRWGRLRLNSYRFTFKRGYVSRLFLLETFLSTGEIIRSWIEEDSYPKVTANPVHESTTRILIFTQLYELFIRKYNFSSGAKNKLSGNDKEYEIFGGIPGGLYL